MVKIVCVSASILIAAGALGSSSVQISEPVSHFAFASCNRQNKPNPFWTQILNLQPQFFLWAGDSVYLDTTNPKVMEKKYRVVLDNPEYQALQKKVPIIGTWDDHDYGNDGAGQGFSAKKISQQLFLDFIGEPQNTVRRHQEGIYTSSLFGPPGKQVKIILLDVRYHLSSSRWVAEDILGEQQWQWLEKELKNSTAQVHFLVSSFSVFSPNLILTESWVDWKKSYHRLIQLVETYQPSGFMILTGDRHFAGMLSKKFPNGMTYYELMSSGMTHVARIITRATLRRIYGKENSVFRRNFGMINLDWDKGPLKMSFQVYTDKRSNPIAMIKNFEMDAQGVWQYIE